MKNTILNTICLFLLSCLFLSLQAQEYIPNVQHFTIEEGLSHWNTSTTFQDSRGFIWVGSRKGLNRFDGHRFQIFNKEKKQLPFEDIGQVLEDAEGWLWVFKLKNKKDLRVIRNIFFINIHTLEVKTLEERFGANNLLNRNDLLKATSISQKTVFVEIQDGAIIQFGSDGRLKMMDLKGRKNWKLECTTEDDHLILKRELGGWENEVVKIDTLGNEIWRHEGNHLKYLGEDKSGTVWLINNPSPIDHTPLELFTIDNHQRVIPYPNDSIIDRSKLVAAWRGDYRYRSSDDTFWYASQEGFWVFHPKKGLLYNFKETYPQVIANKINHLYLDNQENIWVTCENGLYKVQLSSNLFEKYLSIPKIDYRTKNAISTRGILKINGQLWINTIRPENYLINLNTGETTKFKYDKTNKIWSHTHRPILKTTDNKIIFASDRLKTNNLENSISQFIYPKWTPKTLKIWSLFEDSKQTIWAGYWQKGFGHWDQVQDSLVRFQNYETFPELGNNTVYSFLKWDEEHFLIGSTSGIYLFHPNEGIKYRFWKEGQGIFHFPHNAIHHFHRDKENLDVIWVATGGGLIRWTIDHQLLMKGVKEYPALSVESSNSRVFTKKEGLPDNMIYAVYEDNNDNLWIPSDNGIVRFNKKDFSCQIFVEKDGITHHEFNRISHHQDEAGNLYFGGLNGVTAFHPDDIPEDSKIVDAPLEIVNFQQYDTETKTMVDKTAHLVQEKNIWLPPSVKFFTIEFALLEYQDADLIQYQYKLEGQDIDWTLLDDNKLRISGLPYGNFILKIRAKNINGKLSKYPLSIPIFVESPFYLKRWFIISTVLLFLFGSFYFYKHRTNALKERQKELESEVQKATQTIRQQNEALKNLDKVKSRFFANVSHELRTPITLILGPLTSMAKSGKLDKRSQHFAELGKANAKNLLNLVNEILDLTKMESGKVELKEESVLFYEQLQLWVSAFEGMAAQKNIDYQFDYRDNPNLTINLDLKKVQKLVNNLLSNAFKFTPRGGSIRVLVEDQNEFLQLSVQDSGRGIHPNDLPHVFDRYYQSAQPDVPKEGGTGIGLSLSMEFAKLMNALLWVESELGKGSTFYFKLRKKKAVEMINIAPKERSVISAAPLQDFEVPETLSPEEEKLVQQSIEGSTILLVEDNDNLRDYIQLLIGEKYKVEVAENGKIAWNQLDSQPATRNSQPDLIISDIMMPEMDGYQLLEKIKGDDQLRATPVIMLTALADLKDKLKALRIGVDDYITKPFEEEELMARIENLLRNQYYRMHYRTEVKTEKEISENAIPNTNEKIIVDKPSKEDMQWLEELEKITKEKISSIYFSLEELAMELASNRWTVNKRIKKLTGLTAAQYLKEIRLNHARHLLEQKETISVKALSYEVGMKDSKYFSREFRKRFGKAPSAYF